MKDKFPVKDLHAYHAYLDAEKTLIMLKAHNRYDEVDEIKKLSTKYFNIAIHGKDFNPLSARTGRSNVPFRNKNRTSRKPFISRRGSSSKPQPSK